MTAERSTVSAMDLGTTAATEDGPPRVCGRGEYCREARSVRQDNGGYARVPAQTPRTFCDGDRSFIADCLDWLPEAYLQLYMRLPERSRRGLERVAGSPYPPVPPNLEFDALMCEMVFILSSWEERIRRVASLSGTGAAMSRRRRGGVAMTTIRTVLAGHLDALLALEAEPMARTVPLAQAATVLPEERGFVRPAAGYVETLEDLSGVNAGLEILWLHHRCRSVLGLTPKHEDLPLPCWNPDCEHKAVRRWDGLAGLEDEAKCSNCGEVYANDRYRRLMGAVWEREAAKRRALRAS